jgi:hypothetical protein
MNETLKRLNGGRPALITVALSGIKIKGKTKCCYEHVVSHVNDTPNRFPHQIISDANKNSKKYYGIRID